MKFKHGDHVLVHDLSSSWTGTVLSVDRGAGPGDWLYIRPDNSSDANQTVKVPVFLTKVEHVSEDFSPYATSNS